MNLSLIRLTLAGLCLGASAGPALADNFLIVPGKSIGQIRLGPNGAAQLKRLPSADANDNGMQQHSFVWLTHTPGSDSTLFIHAINNAVEDDLKPQNGTFLNEIRVTSRRFHTASGISTGSTLAQIRRRFPSIRPARGASSLYNDTQHGIAFEFAAPVRSSSPCIGISVIKPMPGGSGDAVTSQSEVDDLLKESQVR